jgi:hypothetical protein
MLICCIDQVVGPSRKCRRDCAIKNKLYLLDYISGDNSDVRYSLFVDYVKSNLAIVHEKSVSIDLYVSHN